MADRIETNHDKAKDKEAPERAPLITQIVDISQHLTIHTTFLNNQTGKTSVSTTEAYVLSSKGEVLSDLLPLFIDGIPSDIQGTDRSGQLHHYKIAEIDPQHEEAVLEITDDSTMKPGKFSVKQSVEPVVIFPVLTSQPVQAESAAKDFLQKNCSQVKGSKPGPDDLILRAPDGNTFWHPLLPDSDDDQPTITL